MPDTPHHRFQQGINLIPTAEQLSPAAWALVDLTSATNPRAPRGPGFRHDVWQLTENTVAAVAHNLNLTINATVSAGQHRMRFLVKQIPKQVAVRNIQAFLFDWTGFPNNYAIAAFNLTTRVMTVADRIGTFTGASGSLTYRGRGWLQADILFTMPATASVLYSLQMTDGALATPYNGLANTGLYIAQPFFGPAV